MEGSDQIYGERFDEGRNMARYYALEISPNLFGEIVLERRWGRIGAKGQNKIVAFTDELSARLAMDRLWRRKVRRGYRPR